MNKWLDLAVSKLRQLSLHKIGFWSRAFYDFEIGGDQASSGRGLVETQRKKWVLVVGREHYFETVKDYPIGSRSELKAILKNQISPAPFEGRHIWSIKRLSDKAHRVTSWTINGAGLDQLPYRPIFLIPETACIDLPDTGAGVRLSRLGNVVQIANMTDGVVSSLGSAGTKSKTGLQEKLLGSLGIDDKDDWQALDQHHTSRALYFGAFRALMTAPLDFYVKRDAVQFHAFPWRPAAALAAAVLGLYLLVSSAFLWVHGAWLDRQLSRGAGQADLALDSRRQLRATQQFYDAMDAQRTEAIPRWVAWPIFLDLVKEENLMVAIRTSQVGVLFIGRTDRATDTLARLKRDPRVASAEFKLPVTTVVGLEAFTIEVVFKPLDPLESVPIGDAVILLDPDDSQSDTLEVGSAADAGAGAPHV